MGWPQVEEFGWPPGGSEINNLLQSHGVDHLFGYAMHDRHCRYFSHAFPQYRDKVWGIPFGFAPRFRVTKPFAERTSKVVALGSVNPLRPLNYPVHNYRETADFFPDENWFHKFRRELVLNRSKVADVMDSMLPEFPQIKDFSYDLVEKLNQYKMFVTCESIFFFPSAKAFEGPACGTALIAADHACVKEYGFEDGKNCVMYRLYDLDDLAARAKYYQAHPDALASIAQNGQEFVHRWYSHEKVSSIVADTVSLIAAQGSSASAVPLADRLVKKV